MSNNFILYLIIEAAYKNPKTREDVDAKDKFVGDIYYDKDDLNFYIYTGSSWRTI